MNEINSLKLKHTYRSWLGIILTTMVVSACHTIAPEAPARTTLDSALVVPTSELNVPVYYPVQELEDMINEKLVDKIIEARLAINEKDDSLFLSISRFKPVTIEYNGDRGISYSLPVQIDGTIHSKVIGIKLGNKTPITAKVIISLYSDLYIDKNWNLAPQSRIEKIEWVEEPKLKIIGIKFNLKHSIEKALRNNEEKITSKLDESAKTFIKIRKAIEKVWMAIQKPIRINRKVVRVWLKADVSRMDGVLVRRSKDTLMIEAGIAATLRTILDSASEARPAKPLPAFKRKKENGPGLQAYVLGTVPFTKLNEVFKQVTDTMQFKFKGHTARVKSTEVYGTREGLAIMIELRGDVRAKVYLRGSIGFDSVNQKLIIENFSFDIHSQQSLLQAADWLAHDAIISRIQPYLAIPMDNAFTVIPDLITRGIEKGKLGEKIDVRFDDFVVSFYGSLVTKDNIQVILAADGKAAVGLEKKIFDKKRVTVKR